MCEGDMYQFHGQLIKSISLVNVDNAKECQKQ